MRHKMTAWEVVPPLSPHFAQVLVDRANAFLAGHPGDQDAIRRVLTLKLATVREWRGGDPPTSMAVGVHR
jgi:hypothetical protein